MLKPWNTQQLLLVYLAEKPRSRNKVQTLNSMFQQSRSPDKIHQLISKVSNIVNTLAYVQKACKYHYDLPHVQGSKVCRAAPCIKTTFQALESSILTAARVRDFQIDTQKFEIFHILFSRLQALHVRIEH